MIGKKLNPIFRLNKPAIFEAVNNNALTQTEMMTRASCPRKWYYRYVLRLDRIKGINYHFVYGELMHLALAKLYNSGHYGSTYKEHFIAVPKIEVPDTTILSPDDLDELGLIHNKVQIAFNSYRMHYYRTDVNMRVRKVENVFETTYRGFRLQGKIDMVAHPSSRDGVFIWDWKTSGRFDPMMLDAWTFRFQFLFYCWLYWRCTGERPSGTMVNGLAKSMLRPKLTNRKLKLKETPEEFIKRVREDMIANREKYFYRQRMPLTTNQLERFQKEMLDPHIDSFGLLATNAIDQREDLVYSKLKALAGAMNTGQCHMYGSFCEYLALCKDGHIMLGEYERRVSKHTEMKEEEE